MAEQEQTAVLDAEQTATDVTEQTTSVAEAVAGVAAEAVEGGAEAAEKPEYDLSTQEGVIAYRASNPAFDAYVKSLQDSSFAAGKQNAQKEYRLQQGVEDVGRAALESLARKHGFEPDDDDRENLLWVKANRDAERVAAAEKVIFKGLDSLGLSDEMKATYREQIAELADDPDRLEGIAHQMFEAGSQEIARQQIGNLTLDGVPKDSRLWSSVQAHIASELEKEIEASKAERDPVDNPPRRPAGGAPAGAERFNTMTPAQLAALPPDDWKEFQRVKAGVS